MKLTQIQVILDQIRQKFKNPIFVIIFFIIFFIIVSISYILINLWINAHDHKITVSDLSNFSQMPNTTKEEIYSNIYSIVRANNSESDYSDPALSQMTAEVRDSSFQETLDSTSNIYSGSFIVDLPDLQQSFFVSYVWSPDGLDLSNPEFSYTVTVDCIGLTQMIYPYKPCAFSYAGPTDDYDTIDTILPYSGSVNGVSFSTSPSSESYYGAPYQYIGLSIQSCYDDSKINSALNSLKTYISSFSLNPEVFAYEVQDQCDNNTVRFLHFIGEENPNRETLLDLLYTPESEI